MKNIKIILIICLLLGVFCYPSVQLYSRSSRPLPDLSAFTIVLDPGHGGKATGAVGPGGLTEKQVNLEVAIVLRDLLEERNCKVIMSRTEDNNVRMSIRTGLVKKHKADLFLSLHHNATLAKKWKNHTQTYYAMKQDHSSRQLGRDIHEAMCGMFNFPESKLFSGNYYVLRNCGVTSVLGEPCFISDPVWEDYLNLRSVICNEAIAYYRGLVRYLNRGIVTHRADWLSKRIFFGRTSLTGEVYQKFPLYSIDREEVDIIPITPGKFKVEIDGVQKRIKRSLNTYSVKTELLPFGQRTIEIKGQSDGGNVMDPINKQIVISPLFSDVKMNPGKIFNRGTGGFCIAKFDVSDHKNRLLPDGLQVEFTSEGCTLLRPDVILSNGSCLNVILWDNEAHHYSISTKIGPVIKKSSGSMMNSTDRVIRGRVRDAIGGKVVDVLGMDDMHWLKTHENKGNIRTCGGYFELLLPRSNLDPVNVDIRLPGYEAKSCLLRKDEINEIELKPLYSGILINRRIVLDPFPVKVSSAKNCKNLFSIRNFSIASRLAKKLRRAGAHVQVTRGLWESPSLKKRIAVYNSGGVKLGLAIDVTENVSRADNPINLNLYHYHSSSNGKWFCQSCKRIQSDAQKAKIQINPGSHEELRYTSPAAIVVNPVVGKQFDPEALAKLLFKTSVEYFQSR